MHGHNAVLEVIRIAQSRCTFREAKQSSGVPLQARNRQPGRRAHPAAAEIDGEIVPAYVASDAQLLVVVHVAGSAAAYFFWSSAVGAV